MQENKRQNMEGHECPPKKRECYPWEIFTLRELQHATNNFHNDNKLGEGGFGSVYWGRTSQGTEIAVKRLKSITLKAEMEFAVEVEILGRVRHKNLLGLRGYYAGGDERLIVYDNMPNHSLITHLHGHLADDALLDWHRRMNIIIGTAEGIALDHIVDPRLRGRFDPVQLKNVVRVAMQCTDRNPEGRPTMAKVVEMLKWGGGEGGKREVVVVKDVEEEEDDDGDDDGTVSEVGNSWTSSRMR
ncbi:PTI1-like tyrosine-protein kinase [Acorus calamus]|uniref:PTI1-like tyrosine-protein kinase n=1 Tax=Acorus calamus TaxID=4465 RepID=A0AAV9D5I6_ACOCL|nr:PTI1-like tyrosine-protein kinase [Acorus calamus]